MKELHLYYLSFIAFSMKLLLHKKISLINDSVNPLVQSLFVLPEHVTNLFSTMCMCRKLLYEIYLTSLRKLMTHVVLLAIVQSR